MAAKSIKECETILAEFLDENTLRELKKKHQENYSSRQFLKDLYDIICGNFPADFDQKDEVFLAKGVNNFRLLDVASRVSALFPSESVLQISVEYLRELENTQNYSQCWKICKILTVIVKSCSYEWFVGIDTHNQKILETSNFDKSKNNIVEAVISLLKLINLLPLNAEQLRNHPKLNLFPRILELCHLILEKISENLKDKLHSNFRSSVLKKVSCEFVMTCIQQIGNQHWISNSSKKISLKVFEVLITMCGFCDRVDLLSGMDSTTVKDDSKNGCVFPNGLLGDILENLKLFLAKEKLPDSPVAIHVLVWSVINVKHPFLGEHISMILPPLLLLVDDFRVENQVTGIRTLAHVIENTNATELCWYGRADIIYDALRHRMHTNEQQVTQVLQPCLLKIIQVIEPSSKRTTAGCKSDENLQFILTSMEYESKILMRRAYCSNLASFIDHMGVIVVRHFKRLLKVVFGYLEIGDGETEQWRIMMLDVLKCVILNGWPRIATHSDEILRCLMKLIIDVSMSSIAPANVKHLMFGKIENCLVMLLDVCGEPVRGQLECMTAGLGLREAEELITRALDIYKNNPKIVVN